MKNLLTSLSFIVILSSSLFAQDLSKEEKKALLAEIKEMKKSPEKLLKLKQDLEFSDIVVEQQTDIIADLKKEAQQKEIALSETKSQLLDAQEALATAQKTVDNMQRSGSNAPLNHDGTKYRVQIGLFKSLDISQMLEDPKFIVHEFIDGVHRYSIGNFNTEEEAEAFKVQMRKFGLSGAFVSTYTNGLRTDNLPANYKTSLTPPTNNATSSPASTPSSKAAPAASTPTSTTNNSGFNVKPATYSNSIESNPNRALNGTVISSTPVKVVPQEPVVEEEEFMFKEEENTKTSGIKINVSK